MSEAIKIHNRAEENLQKIEVNSYGDFVYINANDAGIFDRYADFLHWLEGKDAEIEKTRAEMEEKYKDAETIDAFIAVSHYKKELFEEAAKRIDDIFGHDIVHKYFRVMYEMHEGFVPDEECILDFIDTITPALNTIFEGRRKRIEKKYSVNRKGGNSRRYRG